ncbi:hypothetical protein APS67_000631 [Streptomyces sp. AVP053U2]|nr:hypothetical protein APS67_000631 [Streptomyces sp. AVP053U2]
MPDAWALLAGLYAAGPEAGATLPAHEDTVLGEALETAWRALTGSAPAGWGTAEPVNLPWSPHRLTDLARDRALEPTHLLVTGHPGRPALAWIRVTRTTAGIEQDVTLTLGYGQGEEPPLEAIGPLAETLVVEHGLTTMLASVRRASRDLTTAPVLHAPPVPVAFTLGARDVRASASPMPAARPSRYGPSPWGPPPSRPCTTRWGTGRRPCDPSTVPPDSHPSITLYIPHFPEVRLSEGLAALSEAAERSHSCCQRFQRQISGLPSVLAQPSTNDSDIRSFHWGKPMALQESGRSLRGIAAAADAVTLRASARGAEACSVCADVIQNLVPGPLR